MEKGEGIGGFFRSLVGISGDKGGTGGGRNVRKSGKSKKILAGKLKKSNKLKIKKHKAKSARKIKASKKIARKLKARQKKPAKRSLLAERKAKKLEQAKEARLKRELEQKKKKEKELRLKEVKIKGEKIRKLKEEKARKLKIKKEEKERKKKEEESRKLKIKETKEKAERILRERKEKEKKEAEKKAKEEKRKALEKRRIEEKKIKGEFFNLGIPGFSNLVGKGIPLGTSNLIEGGPGSGKTIFCLGVAADACKQGKKVLYMSFEEQEERLKKHMKSFGWDADEFEKKKLLYIKRFNALDIARSVEALLSEAKKELLIEVQPILIPPDFKPDIVLVDSLSSIASAFSGEESRFRIYMEQLFRYLEANGITSFLIRETANPTHIGSVFVERGEAVSFLSDGIIVLYNVFYRNGRRDRAMEIVKMRGIDIDRKIVKAEINGKGGFIIYPNKVLSDGYRLT